jgi:diguanylate cyclase (GGDEF)-like protein
MDRNHDTRSSSRPARAGSHVAGASAQSRWSVWVALAVLSLGLIASVLSYRGLQIRESESLSRYVANLAEYVKTDMLGDLSEQIDVQERMAVRLRRAGLSETAWEIDSQLYLDHHDYYHAVALVAPDLSVIESTARRGAGLVEGRPLRIGDGYRSALARSADTGELVVSEPHVLENDRPGITFLTPIGAGAAHQGFLAVLVDLPAIIETMVPSVFLEQLDLQVSAGDVHIYPFPERSGPDAPDAGFTVDLDGDRRGLRFDFAISEAVRAQLASSVPIMVLVSGGLLSLLLAALVYLGLNARGQASVLSSANRRLEEEIVERESAERELEFMVHHDALTALPNRAGISTYLVDFLESRGEDPGQLALLFLDLDQFKDINDSLGHQLGDQLLCEIPRRLSAVLRRRDFIGRHGGDEFLIAVHRDDREQVEQLAINILRSLDGGFAIEDHRLFISGSIGIAYYPESGQSVSELIQNADTALFKAKSSGRNQYAVFTREMFAQAQHRLNLSRDIRHALDSGDFFVLYQPIIDASDSSLCGVEALLRWQHHDGYLVPPQEFIRVAEETGMIGRLGEFVLDRACSDLAVWQRASGERTPWLAVNVSGAQIMESGFAERLSVLLHRHRIEPERLHLEITEEVLIENLARNRRMLHELEDIGMRIVVDDFGVGYSSLSYLKNFPISIVKIDRGFVRDIASDAEDQAITRTICSLAVDLGMQTVAEGVETDEQLAMLRGYGCTYAQGFVFSRPVSAEAIGKMIAGDVPWAPNEASPVS